MLKHGSPKMISKVNQQINPKLFRFPVCRNESFYRDMQSDECAKQLKASQVIAIPSTRANLNIMRP